MLYFLFICICLSTIVVKLLFQICVKLSLPFFIIICLSYVLHVIIIHFPYKSSMNLTMNKQTIFWLLFPLNTQHPFVLINFCFSLFLCCIWNKQQAEVEDVSAYLFIGSEQKICLMFNIIACLFFPVIEWLICKYLSHSQLFFSEKSEILL